MKYSKSKIMDKRICGRLFYFRYLTIFGKNRQQSSEPLERGKMLHEIYEAFHNDTAKFAEYCEYCKDKPELDNNINVFFALMDRFDLHTTICSEMYVYAEDINTHGYIDAIYKRPCPKNPNKNEIILIDYKTGKFKKNKMAEYRMELYIYEHLANDYFNKLNCTKDVKYITHIGMFFTGEPVDVSFVEPVRDFKRNNAMEKFRATIEEIERGDFTNVSKSLCKVCQFNDICDEYHDDILVELNDHVFTVV